MDVSGVGMDSTNRETMNENKGTVKQCPLRSFSVDANTKFDLYKTKYSYERQNSINNSKDYNTLKDRKNIDQLDFKSNIVDIFTEEATEDKVKDSLVGSTYHVSEIDLGTSASQKLLNKEVNLTIDTEMTDRVFIGKGTDVTDEEYPEKPAGYERQNSRHRICLYRMTILCIVMFLCSLGLLLFVFLKMPNDIIEEEQALESSMAIMSHHNVNVAGSFKINQTHLRDFHRVLWLKDEDSEIVPSTVNDCLQIPYAGKYLVFSRFTFNILPSVETLSITHIFQLKTSDGKLKDGGFKRKYVSVLENKLRTNDEVKANRELRKPSVFIEFFNLDAHDQVCANVSNTNLLYQSTMDNDINIIRV